MLKRARKEQRSESLVSLLRQIKRLRAKAKKLGIFLGDRELLECPRCGLQEDVVSGGSLIVTDKSDRQNDTGLRFAQIGRNSNRWRCPRCGREVVAPDPLELEKPSVTMLPLKELPKRKGKRPPWGNIEMGEVRG